MRNTILLCFILLPLASHAYIHDLGLQFATHTQFVGEIQTDTAGKTEKFSTDPLFTGVIHYKLNEDISLFPEIGFTAFHDKRDSDIDRTMFLFRNDAGYHLFHNFYLRGGVSLVFWHYFGDGGTKTLNNGPNGETTEFYLPPQSETAMNLTLDFGLQYYIGQYVSVRGQGMIYEVLSSTKRAFSYFVGITFHMPTYSNSYETEQTPEVRSAQETVIDKESKEIEN